MEAAQIAQQTLESTSADHCWSNLTRMLLPPMAAVNCNAGLPPRSAPELKLVDNLFVPAFKMTLDCGHVLRRQLADVQCPCC